MADTQADMGGFDSGLAALLSGIFGNSGSPYSAAMDQYKNFFNQGMGIQNPFYQAGLRGMGNYENWANRMSDPTSFINTIMKNYQQSPYAKYQQNQSIRAGQNAASASGMIGSTPFAQQLQQNAQNISSGDMQNWLQNVLGINTQYGNAEGNLMGMGANAANSMSNMISRFGEDMGEAAYGQRAGQNQDFNNIISGFAKMFF